MPYRIQTTLIAAALLTFAGGVMAQTESVPPQTNPIQEILANPAKARKADPSSTEARVIRAADELNVKFSNALTEAVLKLQVNNSTTLEELPEVRTALDAYLESLRNNLPLSAEKDSLRISASLKVDIAKLADVLKPVSAKHHTGTRVRGSDFDMMPALNEKKTLTVSVTQWIPTKFADQPAYKINPETLKADYHLPKLWLENLQPRKVRAARALTRLAARRNGIDRLAVKLADVPIHVGSLKGEALTPRMLFGEKDDMHAVLKSLMRNTAITGIRYHHDVMVCEVEVQTSLKVAVANLKGWVETRGSKEAREHIPTLVKFVQNTKADHLDSMGIAAVSPLYVVPAYDRVQTAMVNLVAATPAWAFTTTSCSAKTACWVDVRG